MGDDVFLIYLFKLGCAYGCEFVKSKQSSDVIENHILKKPKIIKAIKQLNVL